MELGRCKKHPNHKQTKGVCPSCLRERLAQVTASSASSTTTTLHSSSSNASNSSPDEFATHRAIRHRRSNTLLHLFKDGAMEPLRRSRSVALPAAEEKLGKGPKKSGKKPARRFWSKLLMTGAGRSKESGEDRLYHSKTIKEKSSSKWAFFSL